MRMLTAGLFRAILSCSTSAVPALGETIQVTIEKLVFAPAKVIARAGDTIEWVNKDILAHTTTVKGVWEVSIEPKATARKILTEAGSVEYYCRFHPNMKGRIEVAPK